MGYDHCAHVLKYWQCVYNQDSFGCDCGCCARWANLKCKFYYRRLFDQWEP